MVITLIFLAIETRANTRALRASTTNQLNESLAEFNEHLLLNPKIRELMLDSIREARESADEYTKDERETLEYVCLTLFNRVEGWHHLYESGLCDETVWHSKRTWLVGLLMIPVHREWYRGLSKDGPLIPMPGRRIFNKLNRIPDILQRTPEIEKRSQ